MKIDRNDPCLCGSGKKYKKCCLDKKTSARSGMDFCVVEEPIDVLSNQVLDWINQRDFEKAGQGCEQLLKEFPECIDGFERYGLLYEKKGEVDQAIRYYKKCLTFIVHNQDCFMNDSSKYYEKIIVRLEKRNLS